MRRFATVVFALLISSPVYGAAYVLAVTVSSLNGVDTVQLNGSPLSGVLTQTNGSTQIGTRWYYEFDAQAYASATDGQLRAQSSSATRCDDGLLCGGESGGTTMMSTRTQASYGDTVTIFSTFYNGQGGFAEFFFDIDGSTDISQVSGIYTEAFGQMSFCDGPCGPSNIVSDFRFTDSPGLTLVGRIPITFGSAFSFGANLFTNANIGLNNNLFQTLSSEANYFNTATLASIRILNASGELVTDATASGDSDFDYGGVLNSPIPEPASLALAGGALLVGILIRNRRGRSSEGNKSRIRTC